MAKLTAKIENWSIVDNLIFNGFRKLEPGQRLTGYLMGHAERPNGVIYTSVIQSVDSVKGVVETLNTVYQLGEVNEDYEMWASEQTNAAREAAIPAFAKNHRRPAVAYSPAQSLHAMR